MQRQVTSRPGVAVLADMFQSSSGQKAGCNKVSTTITVSVLSFNLSQKAGSHFIAFSQSWRLFQSSSGQKAGCNRPRRSLGKGEDPRFQSSSGQKAGCNAGICPRYSSAGLQLVSILIRPEGRMQLFRGGRNTVITVEGVSILIRPEGRMQQRACLCVSPPLEYVFQSSSGQKAGCNDRDSRFTTVRSKRGVSILIRPEGRMQLSFDELQPLGDHYKSFNPHPARRPDATYVAAVSDMRTVKHWPFQSSSGQKAGCNTAIQRGILTEPRLNVSILIRPEGRMQRVHTDTMLVFER